MTKKWKISLNETSSTIPSVIVKTKNVSKKDIHNFYFAGLSRKDTSQNPSEVYKRYKKILDKWAYNNGNLHLLSYRAKSFNTSLPAEKIIGFSAGAPAAIKFSNRKPESKLILLDPWMMSWTASLQDSVSEFYGPSCALVKKYKNAPYNLKGLKAAGLVEKAYNPETQCEHKRHMSYFVDYFKGKLG